MWPPKNVYAKYPISSSSYNALNYHANQQAIASVTLLEEHLYTLSTLSPLLESYISTRIPIRNIHAPIAQSTPVYPSPPVEFSITSIGANPNLTIYSRAC